MYVCKIGIIIIHAHTVYVVMQHVHNMHKCMFSWTLLLYLKGSVTPLTPVLAKSGPARLHLVEDDEEEESEGRSWRH